MSRPTKADQYLIRLEDSRCEGRWDEVPELVRKVRKHATDRSCLTITAESEYAIVKATQKQKPGSRPSTAVSPNDLDVDKFLPNLVDAINSEQNYPEDKFQAQICLGWLHWTVGEYNQASARLPRDVDSVLSQFERSDDLSEWTRVSILKAAYLKANCLSRNKERREALAIFESALAPLSHVWSGQQGRKQLRFWAELFLTEYCMLQSQALELGEKSLTDSNCLAPFRSWAKYWEVAKAQTVPLAGGYGFRGAVPRRRIWNEYYASISGILQQDLPFPTGNVGVVTNEASARNQLRMELKKAEAAYENLLLSETSFPRADEEREEVENFAAAVMRNWSVLCGREWQEHDLGPGGKEGLSRGVLDILYRAATKTFHSTAILRYLFTVHLSVAEFDLAFHALDSYLDIVKKGKARVDKTGHPEASLDDDATVLETISQAIIALCKYGFREAAEKAYDLGVELEQMLQKLPPPVPNAQGNISTLVEENGNGVILHPRISSRVNGLAWQAIGLSQAHWSRTTYDTSARTELQSKAIRSFQRSLSAENGNPTDVRTLFTLSVLLAEQRELTAAIDIVKAALMSGKPTGEQTPEARSYWRERSLIPLWHLLALLLSARQEYVMAARACEGAFEQFDDPTVLFGPQNLEGTYRSEHLNDAQGLNEKGDAKGLVDEMDDLEKEGIIEVKMTQLALLELLEGPEVAVNASHELLVLYARLFGGMQAKPTAVSQRQPAEVPKSSAGTLRSMRGSIFGGISDRGSRILRRSSILDHDKNAAGSERPGTSHTTASASGSAVAGQTGKESSSARDSRRSSRSASVRGRSESNRRNSLKKRDTSSHQRRRAVSSGATPRESAVLDGENNTASLDDGEASRGSMRFDSSAPPPKGSNVGSGNLVLDSLSPSNPLPTIYFPKEQVKRQRQTTLIKVWLMIASFYRRSGMHEDAKGAIDEAKKLVDSLEIEVVKDTTGSVTCKNPGWGGKKCVEELWGDVRTEMGHLAVAEGTPYVARGYFEEALMHYPDHPSAIVGLSNILLDIYSEVLLPPPPIPGVGLPDGEATNLVRTSTSFKAQSKSRDTLPVLLSTPLGLGGNVSTESTVAASNTEPYPALKPAGPPAIDALPAPHKAVSLPLIDRLAARDRAYGLLSGLTKLGRGWNYSDAWFALARAHEESGQPDKAKDALWWCVELEEGMGVRDWNCVSVSGYVL
ncbi:filamentation protein [Biscogniauxia mediterranea]|nr:filamentation protein [Biscogniauxia mediterranea]